MSTETPPKLVPSFDHLVTQWMSHGTCFERQLAELLPGPLALLGDHAVDPEAPLVGGRRRASGPAVSTGKARLRVLARREPVRQLLGGSAAPLNPRETKSFTDAAYA